MEQVIPATLLQKLLQIAGIEQNPGPDTWLCSVCNIVLRRNVTSVQCNGCQKWCHLRKCTNLQSHREWSSQFEAACCFRNPTSLVNSSSTNNILVNNTNLVNQIQQDDFQPAVIKILQFNCNGITNKIDEIVKFMEDNDILLAAIQETKLTHRSKLTNIGQFSLVRKDRGSNKGGGLAFIIHDSLTYRPFSPPPTREPDNHLEQMGIKLISGNSDISIMNLYIPPSSSCESGYAANIDHLLNMNDCLIVGDINAHNDLWFSDIQSDSRGEDIAEQIDASSFGILNEHSPTRIAQDTQSSPDITLASDSIFPSASWQVLTSLGSDHLPIIVTLGRSVSKVESHKQTFVNFSKADWAAFEEFTEEKFSKQYLPLDTYNAEKVFSSVMKKAARRCIPSGRIPRIRPNFPTSAAILADERDEIRARDPANPRISELNKRISSLVSEHKQKKWHEHVEKSSFNSGQNNLWKVIKGLNNPQKQSQNTMISFDNNPTDKSGKCAKLFNSQFTEKPTIKDCYNRVIVRKLKKLRRSNEDTQIRFSNNDIQRELKRMKSSKAIGPDGISPIMMKHLGPCGINFLTSMLNTSFQLLQTPGVWKTAKIVPLPKPGKPQDQATSFRPISILSPVAKLLEALILPYINNAFTPATYQHGFRKDHSTTTALHQIHEQISNGLNQKRPCSRTVLVALDMKKAFDTVQHSKLLRDVNETSMPYLVKKWLAGYLRGRETFVEFRGKNSPRRTMKQGVPQGSVLSPTLFSLYLNDIPPPPSTLTLVAYADDCTVLATGPNIDQLCEELNSYLATLNDWLSNKNLLLSNEKSTATLFTTWTREVNTELNITINDRRIPTIKNPKLLGVTFDPLLMFNNHAKLMNARLKTRNNALKAIAGSSWGKDKETLITAYKTIGRPIVNYAAPIWSPQLADTHWQNLQASQNAALRIATGCHLMSHPDHLQAETKVLPIRTHNELLTKQFVTACHKRVHPSKNIINSTTPQRNIRKSARIFVPQISSILNSDNDIDDQTCKTAQKQIHTTTVSDAIQNLAANKVLNSTPPQVSSDERKLPRQTRTTLAQLRSGYSRFLNSYMNRLDPTIIDACPRCNDTPHDARHLFECPEQPTTLTTLDLWLQPVEVASFLGLETED